MEEHPHTRDMLLWFLGRLGYWVESASEMDAALDRLRHDDGFDVLLTGLWLPDAPGGDLLGELRRRGELPARVITMGAMNKHEGGVRSLLAGGHAHLATPLPLSELAAALTGC